MSAARVSVAREGKSKDPEGLPSRYRRREFSRSSLSDNTCAVEIYPAGGTKKSNIIQVIMKQPTDQEERNEDQKKPEKENPSHGIDPDPEEPEIEAEKGISHFVA